MKVTQGPLDPEEKKNYTFYWFLFSLVLLVGVFWSLLDEDILRRPWKRYQSQFNKMELKKLKTERDAELVRIKEESADRLKELDQKIAESSKEKRSAAYLDLKKSVEKKEKVFKELEQLRSFTKADLDEAYYNLDHGKILGSSAEKIAQIEVKIQELQNRLNAAATKAAQAEADYNEAFVALKSKDLEIDNAHVEKEDLFKNVQDLSLKIESVASRSIGIKQVVVEGLDKFGRVDRCETCHTAINRAGFEDQPQPFTTHPRLKELLGPHPTDQFGCTACHHGDGRALASVFKAHAYEVVKKAGKEEIEYKEHWEQPMYHGLYKESACNDCHGNQYQLKETNTWAYANRLFTELGCHGCHMVQGYEKIEKVGPDLRRVAHKTNPEWMVGWIVNPTSYNPHTRMPNFRLNNDEATAITAFLLHNSEKEFQFPERYPGAGSIQMGKELVESIGCRGCHVVGDGRDVYDEYRAKDRPVKDHGPELTKVAEKVSAEWLYNWIRNPRGFSPHTAMPSLRLTDWDARNVTSYILSLAKPLPAEPDLRQKIKDEELVKQGRALVNKRGCYGCHLIKGFEEGERIGPELTNFAMKAPYELAYGTTLDKNAKVRVEETWEDWTKHKLESPDVYDTDRVQALMPTFAWRAGEVDTMLTFLKAQDGVKAKAPWARERDARWQAIDRGERLVDHYNCNACHIIEGQGGHIRAYLSDEQQYLAPPNLQGVGKKVQSVWLFNFLHRPSTVRPWLKTRMPSFNLSDDEFTDIIRYFQALDRIDKPYEDYSRIKLDPRSVLKGAQLFQANACLSCHVLGSSIPAGLSESRKASMAPNLRLARQRLRPDWIVEWLADPASLVSGTRMPAFWDSTTTSTKEELASLKKDLATAKTEQERQGIQKDIDGILARIAVAHTEMDAVRDYVLTLSQQ